ncbi:MAG: hypothetical protein RML40_12055, partial [Bacteroidota bacterium]|nr:hypothetical protein [Candidatus Kapabacteria bacterium]MDW8221249.1 hypothetical protein [Bacteroidota bacterium]
RQGGYQNRQGGYQNRQGGYQNRQGGYQNRQGGYQNRQGGYQNRQGGYQKNRHSQPKRSTRPRQQPKQQRKQQVGHLVSLPRMLAIQQFACRKIAVDYIRNARVQVNGVIAQDPNTRVSYKRDVVKVDAMELHRNRPNTYLLINKPVKVPGSREAHTFTIHSMIHDTEKWFFPLGRLRKSASGLTILTNDPIHKPPGSTIFDRVEKEYRIKVHRQVKRTELTAITKALKELHVSNTEVLKVEIIQKNARNCWIAVTLYYGALSDILTILKNIGLEPLSMQRYRIGGLTADYITPGSWKQLNTVELSQLLGVSYSDASFFFKPAEKSLSTLLASEAQ